MSLVLLKATRPVLSIFLPRTNHYHRHHLSTYSAGNIRNIGIVAHIDAGSYMVTISR